MARGGGWFPVAFDPAPGYLPAVSLESQAVDSRPIPAAAARPVWTGGSRPTPADLLTAAYDVDPPSAPERKLLICAAPRTSSKRLSRLLLAAGSGVPMEYFNPNGFQSLITRWNISQRDYLASLYRRRSANHVFASNLQHHQIRTWPYPRDISDLFTEANVIHLTRGDRAAQAVSLAACLLTGNWGFEGVSSARRIPEWRIRRAARQAVRRIAEEDRQWARFFAERGTRPLAVSDEQVNRDDPELVVEISTRLGLPLDVESVRRMLRLDQGAYRVDQELKIRLRAFVQACQEQA
jgi:LPS sulfotransferase NodH